MVDLVFSSLTAAAAASAGIVAVVVGVVVDNKIEIGFVVDHMEHIEVVVVAVVELVVSFEAVHS